MEIYLDLKKKNLEDSMKDAIERAKDQSGDEDGEDNLLYEDIELKLEDFAGFDEADESVNVSGTMEYKGKELGYISCKINLDIDDIISIIECYRKKLGKLKTVLEATK